MLSKRRIAILVSGLFLGAGIGMAALDESASSTEAEAIEQQPFAEAEAPAEAQVAQSEAAAAPVVAAAVIEPVTFGDVFPPSADDYPHQPNPLIVAYFAQRAHIQLTGATQPVYPASGDDEAHKPSRAVLAYFEQREGASQMAAVQAEAAQPSAAERLWKRVVGLFQAKPAATERSASDSATTSSVQ